MNKIKLGEISLKITSGLTPSRTNKEFWDNGVIDWIKTEQVGQKYIYNSTEKISIKALNNTTIKLNPIDTLSIAMYGEGKTRGSVSILKKEATTNQACCNIIIDKEKANVEYLYYKLKTQYENLRNLSSGVRKNLNSNDIRDFEISIHNIHDQQNIASILSALDDKIELNNSINAELEQMAKTLYDYWFVQFDFPNEEGKPYKSSGGKMVYNEVMKKQIPQNWERKTINDLFCISNNSINPLNFPEKLFKHYSIPTWDKIKSYGHELGSTINSNKFMIKKGDVLVSKLNPWFNRVIYNTDELDMICSTEFVILQTTSIEEKAFLYQLAKSKNFIDYCILNATGTSNSHKRVNPQVLIKYQIPFCYKTIANFGTIIHPMLEKINANLKQNQELASLRDWLLPMLMNGQVKVKD